MKEWQSGEDMKIKKGESKCARRRVKRLCVIKVMLKRSGRRGGGVCLQRDKGDNRAKGVGGGVRLGGGENVQSAEEWEGQRERQRGEGEVKD